ncbi:MAG: hypothetical protein NC299_18515 [Lachnospiraceae bacterium]|nr:hypothetical protein [Lachnospiraceae bacterium]
MNMIGMYKNGNFRTILLSDGTKIRETEDDEFVPDFAENMDIKITNYCDMECKFCFSAGTKVLMGDFSYKNIEDIEVGEEVIGFEENPYVRGSKRKLIKTKVLKTFVHVEEDLINVETEDGNKVTATPNHPFLSAGTGANHFRKFNKLGNIKVGSELFTMYYQIKNIDYSSENYNLGYLVGAWVGDGHIGHCIDHNGYDLYTCRFVTLDDEINDKVYEVTKPYCDIYRLDFNMSNGSTKISVGSGKKDTYDILNGLISSNLKKNNSIEYYCGFLAGIYDSEGHIDKQSKIIRICNTDLNYIEETERCLNGLSIPFVREKASDNRGNRHKTLYNVRVVGNGGWGNFLRLTNPTCIRKGLQCHAFDITQYNGTKIVKKIPITEKQYVYNLETECHTYIANNYLVHNCHEGSSTCGKHGDILNQKFIDTLHPYQEVAIGGGDTTSHPDLIPFLQKLKEKKVIANITVNQVHFEQKQDLIKRLVDEKLIYGLGVSLVNPTKEFIETVRQYPNAVIHVINGIFSPADYRALANQNLKLLILGYKNIRRGKEWHVTNRVTIDQNWIWLKDNLGRLLDKFKVVSFDNLAIEQLDVRRLLTDDEWNEFYMGQDGNFTYFLDMVEQKFAKSSTAALEDRYPILDSVDDMFKVITGKYKMLKYNDRFIITSFEGNNPVKIVCRGISNVCH